MSVQYSVTLWYLHYIVHQRGDLQSNQKVGIHQTQCQSATSSMSICKGVIVPVMSGGGAVRFNMKNSPPFTFSGNKTTIQEYNTQTGEKQKRSRQQQSSFKS
eukprot:988853-Amphidinium_carterae.2